MVLPWKCGPKWGFLAFLNAKQNTDSFTYLIQLTSLEHLLSILGRHSSRCSASKSDKILVPVKSKSCSVMSYSLPLHELYAACQAPQFFAKYLPVSFSFLFEECNGKDYAVDTHNHHGGPWLRLHCMRQEVILFPLLSHFQSCFNYKYSSCKNSMYK